MGHIQATTECFKNREGSWDNNTHSVPYQGIFPSDTGMHNAAVPIPPRHNASTPSPVIYPYDVFVTELSEMFTKTTASHVDAGCVVSDAYAGFELKFKCLPDMNCVPAPFTETTSHAAWDCVCGRGQITSRTRMPAKSANVNANCSINLKSSITRTNVIQWVQHV